MLKNDIIYTIIMLLGEFMNEFEIINETEEKVAELSKLEDVINFALKHENIKNSIFNIIIVGEKAIRELNKNYRGKDSVTDVISFALEDDNTFVKTDFRVLGDIYICLPKAKSQALEYGHSFFREISFLAIHGLLHLLGYDHMNEEDEKVMFGLQELILSEFGIKRED